MDRLLLDFRRSPAGYLSSRGIASHELVDELLQVILPVFVLGMTCGFYRNKLKCSVAKNNV